MDWQTLWEMAFKYARKKRNKIEDCEDFAQYYCMKFHENNKVRMPFVFIDFIRMKYVRGAGKNIELDKNIPYYPNMIDKLHIQELAQNELINLRMQGYTKKELCEMFNICHRTLMKRLNDPSLLQSCEEAP